MNYLFLDSSPNKDQKLAFTRDANPIILNKMKERNIDEPSTGLQSALFSIPSLEKEQVDIKQTDNELLVLVNNIKHHLIDSDKNKSE